MNKGLRFRRRSEMLVAQIIMFGELLVNYFAPPNGFKRLKTAISRAAHFHRTDTP